jgi:BirA family biotin operon repressor/biotin-[acetyl-CoA-carboxylase] ligase
MEAKPPRLSRELDLKQLRQLLDTELFGKEERLVYVSEIGSTNTLAMELARKGSEEGVVVLTDSQTAGKGRQGRRWVDMAGSNAISSTILRPDFPPHLLVMVASLAVVAAITETCGISAAIKWPNDIQIGEQKVAGILIETSTDRMGRFFAILGIGVNVNGSFRVPEGIGEERATALSTLRTELASRATTLEDSYGHEISRETFLANLLRELESYYLALQQEARTMAPVSGPISRRIREQWRDRLSTLGRTVQVRQGETVLSGVAEEVNEHGELLLRCHSGELTCITWGDVGQHSQKER